MRPTNCTIGSLKSRDREIASTVKSRDREIAPTVKSRDREIAPTVKSRDREIAPTGELNDPNCIISLLTGLSEYAILIER